jgi:hypothetical protein
MLDAVLFCQRKVINFYYCVLIYLQSLATMYTRTKNDFRANQNMWDTDSDGPMLELGLRAHRTSGSLTVRLHMATPSVDVDLLSISSSVSGARVQDWKAPVDELLKVFPPISPPHSSSQTRTP